MTIWLRLFGTESDPLGRGNSWVEIRPSGEQRRVDFPGGFSPLAFLSDSALGVLDDPMKGQWIGWIDLGGGGES